MVAVESFDVIICKLNYQQEFGLITLLKTNKNSKISLYSAVLPLYLVISLRVKGNRELLLNVKEITKQQPEFHNKN